MSKKSYMLDGKNGRKKPIVTILTIILMLCAAFLGIDVSELLPTDNGGSSTISQQEQEIDAEGQLIMKMFEVGQGDSFFFQKGDDTALIDCSTSGRGDDVVKYLKELGITQIDYVIGTHPHEDHMGGMRKVISNFEIGTIITPKVGSDENVSPWYGALKNKFKKGKYNVKYAEFGDTYILDEDVIFEVIGPVEKLTGNLNNYSIVLKVSFGEMDIIMTGDAEVDIETQILEAGIDIDAEIYKAAHHGSDTSNSEEFLDAISPQYGLISCKKGNRYGHPMKSVMKRFQERDIEIYRTDECGTVTLIITPNSVTFDCESGDYLSGNELEDK